MNGLILTEGCALTTAYYQGSESGEGIIGVIRRAMPRDELFAGLYIVGCVNGIAGLIIQNVNNGNDWLSVTLNISAIVLFACVSGIALVLSDKTDTIRTFDLVVAAVFLVVIVPSIGALNWMAVTGLSFYLLLFARGAPERTRGAITLLAVTVPMLWSRLLFAFFSKYFLDFDSALVAFTLNSQRDGNMVRFADGSGNLVIFPGCSSVANLSLAFLCWVTATQITNHRRSAADILWCSLTCASVVVVNVIRMSLEGMSQSNFSALHNPRGDMIFNTATIILMGFFTVMGVRRELFSRP